ncbi:MAG: glycosyltransferase [Bacteroidales bacterium]|nr:glycosyltransferase [Bacteroidales bacterium]
MAIANPDPAGPQPDFPLEHFKFPVFEPIIRANGFSYARIDRKIIRKAVEWADIVHFEEALFLQNVVRKIALRQGKTCTATFHLYPHNITANLGLPKRNLVNTLLIRNWRRIIYNHCTDIQCPSGEVRRYLARNGVKARLHVISNGIRVEKEVPRPLPVEPAPVVEILCTGRLAREKSQATLLEAMRYSRYADRIRLVFAGNGPKVNRYRRLASRMLRDGVLKLEPVFGFYNTEELNALARRCYLYVHCAYVEVEGLSCLEAAREGLVPVIAQGDLIGTSAFALCPESLYPVQDSRALAARIDWWIEHPEERNRMSQRHADAARDYSIDKSIDQLIAMYRHTLEEKRG